MSLMKHAAIALSVVVHLQISSADGELFWSDLKLNEADRYPVSDKLSCEYHHSHSVGLALHGSSII